MLRNLYVKNLAVAEDVAVEPGPGFNVLTGETGAGKSILVDSLGLLAGARATGEMIRSEAEELTVSGAFDEAPAEVLEKLADAGVECGDGDLVVRRVVNRSGRNRVFLNDEPVTLRLLATIAPGLLRIHTQREELGLISPEFQRRWLDRAGGQEAVDLLAATRAAHDDYRKLADRWERLVGDERLRLERLDLLRFQAKEIDSAAVEAGEEDDLRAERERLRHGEAIGQAIGGSQARLFEEDGSAVDALSRSERTLAEIEQWEPDAAGWAKELAELRVRLEELAPAMRARIEAVDADPTRLDAIEDRLALLERLLRKYGETTAEVIAQRASIAEELNELEADDEQRAELENEVGKALERYKRRAGELSKARRRWAETLAEGVHRELADLAMGRARFEATFDRRKRRDSPLEVDGVALEFGPAGYDEVSFQLAANPGEPLGPVAKVASGGELSRVYLALQLAARAGDEGSSSALVFDEVDAGIGGAEAAALGRKLERLARGGQVLAVTHLPQVASFADRHFRIRKRVAGGRTRMEIQQLDSGSRVDEVARMLAGKKVTDLSRSHAEELISVAGKS